MSQTMWKIGLVLVFVAAVGGTGCSDKSGNHSLESGLKKLENNDIPGAIRYLQKAAAIRPHDATALCNLGIAYYKNGQHAEAIAALRRASIEVPTDPRPLELIVQSLLALNNPDAARESAQRALTLTPESPRLTTLMACVEQKAGHTALAQKYLTEALQLDKDYAPALYDLGLLYHQQGNRDDLADNLLRRYLAQAGDDPHAAEVKALLDHDQPPPLPKAETTTRAPTETPVITNRSKPKVEVADTPSPPPPPAATSARDVRAEAMVLFNSGLKAQQDGKTKAAIQFYQDALRTDPSLARAAYNLGLLHMNARHHEEAQQAFEAAIRADDHMEKAYLQAGVEAMNRKKNVEALQHLTTLLRFAPNNIEARYLAGVACVNMGRRDAARVHFTAYLKLAPKGPMAGYIRTWLKQQS